jgi:hypothetical protein
MKIKETFTVRPQPHNREKLMKKLNQEKKRINSSSMSNTVETILLNYFNLNSNESRKLS